MRRSRALLAALACLAGPAARADAPAASPLLPPDHWAVRAADQLEALGLLARFMPAQRAVPLLEVAAALDEAGRRAPAERPEVVALVAGWRERLGAEWPGLGRAALAPRLLGAEAEIGYAGSAATERPGPPATGGSALHLDAPGDAPFAGAGGAAAWGDHLAASAAVRATPDDVALTAGELVAALGPLRLSAGRGPVAFGPSELGGVTSSGLAALDRLELATAEPFRLPWFLDALGEVTIDTALARLSEPRHPYGALLWLTQLQLRPHPRFIIGFTRGYMFGGALWDGISFADASRGLLGVGNYMGNNVMSGFLRYRLPTEGALPLTLRFEWGTDDNPGAMFSWPGLLLGLSTARLPGVPVALGLEGAYFGRGTTDLFSHDPFSWYAHGQYKGGWATGETPLGDPLGGNGRALRLRAAADPVAGVLRLEAVGWLQERTAEGHGADDLYAPMAAGRSAGASGAAEVRWGRVELRLSGSYEEGSGWDRSAVEAGVRLFF